MIDWCLTLTLAVFQLYRGVKEFYINLRNLHDPYHTALVFARLYRQPPLRERSYNPTARWFNSPTEMCLIFNKVQIHGNISKDLKAFSLTNFLEYLFEFVLV